MSTEIQKREPSVDEQRQELADRVSGIVMCAVSEAQTRLTKAEVNAAMLGAFRKNPKLFLCDVASIVNALTVCAQLGLPPNTTHGYSYLVPFKSECTAIIGYKGYLHLARRSAEITGLFAEVVFAGEHLALSAGTDGVRIDHRPDPARSYASVTRDNAAQRIVGAYAVCTTKTGTYSRWVSYEDIEARRKRGGGANSGKKTPWDTDYAAMARKSAVRALFGSGEAPMSDEIARALEVEQETEDRYLDAVQAGPLTAPPEITVAATEEADAETCAELARGAARIYLKLDGYPQPWSAADAERIRREIVDAGKPLVSDKGRARLLEQVQAVAQIDDVVQRFGPPEMWTRADAADITDHLAELRRVRAADVSTIPSDDGGGEE